MQGSDIPALGHPPTFGESPSPPYPNNSKSTAQKPTHGQTVSNSSTSMPSMRSLLTPRLSPKSSRRTKSWSSNSSIVTSRKPTNRQLKLEWPLGSSTAVCWMPGMVGVVLRAAPNAMAYPSARCGWSSCNASRKNIVERPHQ